MARKWESRPALFGIQGCNFSELHLDSDDLFCPAAATSGITTTCLRPLNSSNCAATHVILLRAFLQAAGSAD